MQGVRSCKVKSMKLQVFALLLLSTGLFLTAETTHRRFSFHHNLSPALESRYYLLRYQFQEPQNASLLTSYVTGVKRGFNHHTRQVHKELHLLHLFTPSGIHFQALFLLLYPLVWYQKRTKNSWALLALIALCLSPLSLNGYESLKRIGLLKTAFLLRSQYKIPISPFALFLLIFALDYIFGTYQDSPLSFTYSFLFLGLIFSSLDRPKIFFILNLFLGQILVGFLTQTPIYLFGFAAGLVLTSLFTILFPCFFLIFWLSPYLPAAFAEAPIHLYRESLMIAEKFVFWGPVFTPCLMLAFCLIGYFAFLNLEKPLKGRFVFLALIMLTTSPLENQAKRQKTIPAEFQKVQSKEFKQAKYSRYGIRFRNEKNQRCRLQLYNGNAWREHCRS